ncbi:hypothetical protein BX666DRAFT_1233467 [Dichotomocladium elegans]|nr:hypothetical protein BX666DRAFT_1233467 [Dichotomocladium elegans]
MYLSNVQHISTLHLCLAEIAMLLPQLARLRTVQCLAIETWCAAQALDLAILLGPQSSSSSSSSRHVEFQFKDVTGFTSMSVSRAFDTAPQIETLRVINLRDEDYIYVYKVLNEIATAQDSDEEDEERRQQNAVQMMRQWRVIEDRLVSKYKWIASMAHISSFTFGFCYVWTAAVWREALLPICPNLKHLELHGWSQLGSIPGTNQIMDIRRDSEDAMAACFAAATRLRSLVLVDFPISSITSKTLSATHVRIAYSKNWSEPVVVEELHEFLESLHNTQEVILDVPMQQPFRSTIDSQFRHPLLKMKLYS